jgi:hypothetical protein
MDLTLSHVLDMEVPSSIQTMGTIKPRSRALSATVFNIWMLQSIYVAMGLTGRNATCASQRKSGPLDASQRTVDGEIAHVVSVLAQRARDVRAESERSQVYIAIDGAPGSGKSHLAQLVSDYMNQSDHDNADSFDCGAHGRISLVTKGPTRHGSNGSIDWTREWILGSNDNVRRSHATSRGSVDV